jgi:membrane protein YdbS with pleckstrin-like domain
MCEKTEWKRLPFRVAVLWEIMLLLTAGLLFWGVYKIFAVGTLVWYIILAVLGGVYLFFAVLYIPLYFVGFQMGFFEDYLLLRSGVFVQRSKYQKRDQISVVSVMDNPITPLLHLSSLSLKAPGSSLFVPLMDTKTADEIASAIGQNRKV